jgi:uncharacterized membrane-anchored protein YjiN (DUF445 family)
MDNEIIKYAKNPQPLLDLLSALIEYLVNNEANEALNSKNIQLIEINKAIKALERRDVLVPDSLRSEKSKLVAEISSLSTMPNLQLIQNELEEMLANLKVDDSKKNKIKRTRSKLPKTDNATLRKILLDVLKESGGKAKVKEIKNAMGKKLKDKFLPGDLTLRSDGRTVVWFNNVQWERLRLVQTGILKSDSPSGLWELAGDEE